MFIRKERKLDKNSSLRAGSIKKAERNGIVTEAALALGFQIRARTTRMTLYKQLNEVFYMCVC